MLKKLRIWLNKQINRKEMNKKLKEVELLNDVNGSFVSDKD